MDSVILFLGSLLTGTALGVVLKFLIDRGRLSLEEKEALASRKRSDFDRALEVVTGQRDDALQLVKEIRGELDQMKMEAQGLRLARDLDPFPNWIVGLDGKYLYANREFEKQFLEPQGKTYRAIIGDTHESLWPDPFCRILRNLDTVARRVPDGRAKASTSLEIGGVERRITVHKFPIRVQGIVVGFAGFITDMDAAGEAVG